MNLNAAKRSEHGYKLRVLKTFSSVALSKGVLSFLVAVFPTAVTREVPFLINSPADFYTSSAPCSYKTLLFVICLDPK